MSNIFPSQSGRDVMYRTPFDAKCAGQVGLAFTSIKSFTDGPHVIWRQDVSPLTLGAQIRTLHMRPVVPGDDFVDGLGADAKVFRDVLPVGAFGDKTQDHRHIILGQLGSRSRAADISTMQAVSVGVSNVFSARRPLKVTCSIVGLFSVYVVALMQFAWGGAYERLKDEAMDKHRALSPPGSHGRYGQVPVSSRSGHEDAIRAASWAPGITPYQTAIASRIKPFPSWDWFPNHLFIITSDATNCNGAA